MLSEVEHREDFSYEGHKSGDPGSSISYKSKEMVHARKLSNTLRDPLELN